MKYVIYAIFLALPFANKPIAEVIYPVELPLIFGMLMLPFVVNKSTVRLNALDILVVAYAVFGLLSVVVGAEHLYESARYYRLMVLTPVLLYLVIRFGAADAEILRKAVFFIIPGAFWQGVLLLHYYVMHGERPVNVEGAASTITLSVVFCFALAVLLFGFSRRPGAVLQWARYLLAAVLGVMLFVCFTRASLIGFIVIAPLIGWLWREKRRRRHVRRAAFGMTLGLLAIIFSGAILYSGEGVENAREIQHSVDRLFDIDLYLNDFAGRVAFWGHMAQSAMQSPILGSGAESYTVGHSGGTIFHLGSAHNVLISTLITGGLIGLAIFMGMVFSAYGAFQRFPAGPGVDALGKLLMLTLSCALLVALTNDLTGGRVFLWFVLLALIARSSVEINKPATSESTEAPVMPGDRLIRRQRASGVGQNAQ